jgi:hypothetical protein
VVEGGLGPLPSPSLGIKGAVTTVPERIAPPTPQSSFEDEEVVWTAAVSPGNVTPTWVSLGRRAEEETEGETEEKTKEEIEETEETEETEEETEETDVEGEKENSLLKRPFFARASLNKGDQVGVPT